MEPAPELASPPETVQVTVAAPPLSVAVNCSTGELEEFVALQPVQLVSMVPVPGEMENSPFDPPADAEPPQPARANTVGTARAERSAAERRREIPRLLRRFTRLRRSAVTDPVSFNSFSAFHVLHSAPKPHAWCLIRQSLETSEQAHSITLPFAM